MPTSVPPPSRSKRKRPLRKKTKTQRQKQPANVNSRLPYVRLLLVWSVLLSAAIALGANLYKLQIVQGSLLANKAKQQQIVLLKPFIPRRQIVDSDNNVLAIDRPVYTLYAHPKLFKKSKQEIALALSPILRRQAVELTQLFGTRNTGIKVDQVVSEDASKQIKKLQLDGLDLIERDSRLYFHDRLFSDVVGYINLDRQAQAGVEYTQRKSLERYIESIKLNRRGDGALMSDRLPKGFFHVDDLQLELTINNRLQRASRLRLEEQLQKFGAKRGGAIVMDARDGAILTMVSYPSYDSNTYNKSKPELLRNWLVSDLYEPGSTFKPVNIAIALETGSVRPNDVFPDPDVLKVGGWSIKNAEKEDNKSLSIAGILQYSSNVGMVQVMQRLQPSEYYKWLQKLELTKPVGIDLPSETAGQLKARQQFISSPIEPATTSFGQGFSLTPIKLVQLHGALANGGKLVTPHVVRGLVDTQKRMHWQPQLPQQRQIFSPKTTQTVVGMMEKVVENGTGKAAQVLGYRIAGKTGTAQKASSTGGYEPGAKITSFVGIFPVESPRYVVLVVIDEPKGDVFGSTTAAPVVKSIIESLIAIERLPPTKPVTVEASPKP